MMPRRVANDAWRRDPVGDLEQLLARMEQLGAKAADAAVLVNDALGRVLPRVPCAEGKVLLSAIADVMDIVTERSFLAHEARRLVRE